MIQTRLLGQKVTVTTVAGNTYQGLLQGASSYAVTLLKAKELQTSEIFPVIVLRGEDVADIKVEYIRDPAILYAGPVKAEWTHDYVGDFDFSAKLQRPQEPLKKARYDPKMSFFDCTS
jgi:small nuclear ribonucleoprotein (snRNP)-like protein